MEERLKIYRDCMGMIIAQRYMLKLRDIGAAPHPGERDIELAVNALAPGFRDMLLVEAIQDEYVEGCDAKPDGVEKAVRFARAFIEAFGYAETPRRTTSLCQL